jgi:hypothetical protein
MFLVNHRGWSDPRPARKAQWDRRQRPGKRTRVGYRSGSFDTHENEGWASQQPARLNRAGGQARGSETSPGKVPDRDVPRFSICRGDSLGDSFLDRSRDNFCGQSSGTGRPARPDKNGKNALRINHLRSRARIETTRFPPLRPFPPANPRIAAFCLNL